MRASKHHFHLTRPLALAQKLVERLGEASFSSDKVAFLKTALQNYVFTGEQAATLLGSFSFDSDKAENVGLFEGRLTDPADGAAAVAAACGGDDDIASTVAGWPAAESREVADYPIEDDGHRDDADIERFCEALDEASMSDDKVAVAEAECAEHPSPPFDVDQLITILGKFSFSDDAARVLEAFTGPQIVYPFSCEDCVRVLEVFSMSDDKKKVLVHLKPFIKDAQNKLDIVSSFTFSSDKTEVEEILRDLVVDFRPKTPPMAAIQEALRRVGNCPAGYAWRQVSGGWRCAAGGHWVSDDTLASAM